MSDRFARYRTLVEKVDAHAERAISSLGDGMRCALGCTACCRQDLRVSRVEADHIVDHLRRTGRELPTSDAARGPLDDHDAFEALVDSRAPCVFLGPGGACAIYEVRPIICRSHGLPVRIDGMTDACPLNFVERRGESGLDLPDGDVLSLDTTNVILTAVDQLYCQQAEVSPEREPLSAVRVRAERQPTFD